MAVTVDFKIAFEKLVKDLVEKNMWCEQMKQISKETFEMKILQITAGRKKMINKLRDKLMEIIHGTVQ